MVFPAGMFGTRPRRPVVCPQSTDALSRWVYRVALRRDWYGRWSRRALPVVLRLYALALVACSDPPGVVYVPRFALTHLLALWSRPLDVWKVCRDGVGTVRVCAWLLRLAALGRALAPPTPWRTVVPIAVAVLLFAAQVYASTLPPVSGVGLAALATTTIWEVESGGSDTLNGGAFDPGQTAGMFTDLAATNANTASPVVTSASYNFVAGDVGAWLYIASGTNWLRGFYKIVSVSSNAATLSAAVGAAVQFVHTAGAAQVGLQPSVTIGCASTASPTAATWSIDYSQQAAAQFAYTDLASAGAGLTVSSALKPFGKQQVGNSIVITGGTNFNTGRYVIASVAAVTFVATVVGPGNITSGVGASGTGGQGGAFATPGAATAPMVASNLMYVQTATYTMTSASTNIAGGCCLPPGNSGTEGYATVRGDLNAIAAAGAPPTFLASGIATFVLWNGGGASNTWLRNVIVDGASLTSSRGVAGTGASSSVSNVFAKNCTNGGIVSFAVAVRCKATGCATISAFNSITSAHTCVAYSNTITGFGSCTCLVFTLSYSNSGASSDGIGGAIAINCTTYGNGRDGFRTTSFTINCIAESNTGIGYNVSSNTNGAQLLNDAAYNNTGGDFSVVSTTTHGFATGSITGTASFFTNAAGGDFSLNTAAGGGALLRAAGYPGVLPIGGTGYLDIGALQSHGAAAAILVGHGLGVVQGGG